MNTHSGAHIFDSPNSSQSSLLGHTIFAHDSEENNSADYTEPPSKGNDKQNEREEAQISGSETAPRRKTPHKEKRFKGIPASPGIVIGEAVTFVIEPITIRQTLIDSERIDTELERFRHAVEECTAELNRTIAMANDEAPVAAPILEAQLFMLNDPSVSAMVTEYISKKRYTADHAVQDVFDSQQAMMLHTSDAYLRERAVDLEHVKQRLLNFLAHRNITAPEISTGSIVISEALTPSDVMLFRKTGMAAFATESSGITSHAAILARSMGLPAVVGLANVCKRIHTGTMLIIDGFAGIIISHPHPETLERYQRRQQDLVNKARKMGKYASLPAQTLDGRKVHLFANADTPEEIELARTSGAEGIGLIRTELQMLERQLVPTEEEQTQLYTDLAERAYPLQITLRAFDIGSDKSFGLIGHEPNPALGLRGLRFLLKNRAIFTAQIRAILRASCHRNVRIMLPMITTVQEFQKALSMIEGCKASLRENGESFDEHIPVGAMIETPAAALIARELSALADFFSIGTNDLTQYTLAADRMNANITPIYDTFHPAILRLISMTIEAAHNKNIPVAVCGEFAAHAAATELLVGMGISELSVAHTSLLDVKKRIRKVDYSTARTFATESLTLATSSEVRKYLMSATK